MTCFMIPESLNLRERLISEGFPKLAKPLVLDKFHYVIDVLTKAAAWRRRRGYVPINAQLLRSIIGKRFATTIKTTLLRLGVIETDGSYRASHVSTGYRLNPALIGDHLRSEPIRDPKMVARFRDRHRARFLRAREGNSALEAIGRTLEMVKIDFEASDRFMETATFKSERARQLHIGQLAAWREKRFYLSLDQQGRVHHNYVSLPNELKRFSTIEGEPIFAADVSNMQPALLTLLYPEPCDERARFINLVRTNKFYEWFNDQLSAPFDRTTRKRELKQLVFRKLLFSHNAVEHEIRDFFQDGFPILAGEVWKAKEGFHKRLARRLQSLEARVIIDDVIRSLAKTQSHMPILSIHDCIATTEEFVSIAATAIKQGFFDLLGFELPTKITRITRDPEPPALLLPN